MDDVSHFADRVNQPAQIPPLVGFGPHLGSAPLGHQHGPCLLSQALALKCPFGARAEVGSVQDVSVLVLTTACGC